MTAMVPASRDVALKLHAVLRDLDPKRFRIDAEAAVRAKLTELDAAVAQLLAETSAQGEQASRLRGALTTVRAQLAAGVPEAGLPSAEQVRAEYLALRRRLQPAYEELAARLKDARIHVPSLRPANYQRNLVHVGFGIFAIALVVWVPMSWLLPIALGWTVLAWVLESTRRIWPRWNDWLMARVFHRISHPHEAHSVNSATWYASAMTLLAATQSLPVIVTGLAVLGFGDPAAAIVGRRWGRIRLMHGRSLEGSVSFAVVGTLGAAVALALIGLDASLPELLAVAGLGAGLGAVGELFSLRVDDNFSVPLSAGAGAALAMLALGLPF